MLLNDSQGVLYELTLSSGQKVSYRSDEHVIVVPPETLYDRLLKKRHQSRNAPHFKRLGMLFMAVAAGGIIGPNISAIRLETSLATSKVNNAIVQYLDPPKELPASAPILFDPLKSLDGTSDIVPIDNDFSVIVPKIGINAKVIPNVDPTKTSEYSKALMQGVAHANTSMTPDQDGTVYLFSHSTSYDWFVEDLNAIFYHLKNLEKDDLIVLVYKGKRYTYRMTEQKVVSPRDITYLYPTVGKRQLILQTCWPPGSIAQRLLIFADLVEEKAVTI
jgi:LPXTG-site transpeptidase (sortase) family protein